MLLWCNCGQVNFPDHAQTLLFHQPLGLDLKAHVSSSRVQQDAIEPNLEGLVMLALEGERDWIAVLWHQSVQLQAG